MNKFAKGYGFTNRARSAFKGLVGTVAVGGSSLALAVDDAVVTAAQAAGEASVLNATNGLLAIIAIVVGISLVLSIMKRA